MIRVFEIVGVLVDIFRDINRHLAVGETGGEQTVRDLCRYWLCLIRTRLVF